MEVLSDSGLNAVLTHGVRGAFFKSKWIVINVPAVNVMTDPTDTEIVNKRVVSLISTDDILFILKEIWGKDAPTIEKLTLSAHSRGVNALMYTLGGSPVPGENGTGSPTIDINKVDEVTVFDDNSPELGPTMTQAKLQAKARVILATEETNKTGLTAVDLRSPKVVATDPLLAKECWRAIGYARFVQDAMRMGVRIPPDKLALANLLLGAPQWQERGQFTLSGIQELCAAQVSQGNMQKILDKATGLRSYVYSADLIRLGGEFPENVERHHFFVAEVMRWVVRS